MSKRKHDNQDGVPLKKVKHADELQTPATGDDHLVGTAEDAENHDAAERVLNAVRPLLIREHVDGTAPAITRGVVAERLCTRGNITSGGLKPLADLISLASPEESILACRCIWAMCRSEPCAARSTPPTAASVITEIVAQTLEHDPTLDDECEGSTTTSGASEAACTRPYHVASRLARTHAVARLYSLVRGTATEHDDVGNSESDDDDDDDAHRPAGVPEPKPKKPPAPLSVEQRQQLRLAGLATLVVLEAACAPDIPASTPLQARSDRAQLLVDIAGPPAPSATGTAPAAASPAPARKGRGGRTTLRAILAAADAATAATAAATATAAAVPAAAVAPQTPPALAVPAEARWAALYLLCSVEQLQRDFERAMGTAVALVSGGDDAHDEVSTAESPAHVTRALATYCLAKWASDLSLAQIAELSKMEVWVRQLRHPSIDCRRWTCNLLEELSLRASSSSTMTHVVDAVRELACSRDAAAPAALVALAVMSDVRLISPPPDAPLEEERQAVADAVGATVTRMLRSDDLAERGAAAETLWHWAGGILKRDTVQGARDLVGIWLVRHGLEVTLVACVSEPMRSYHLDKVLWLLSDIVAKDLRTGKLVLATPCAAALCRFIASGDVEVAAGAVSVVSGLVNLTAAWEGLREEFVKACFARLKKKRDDSGVVVRVIAHTWAQLPRMVKDHVEEVLQEPHLAALLEHDDGWDMIDPLWDEDLKLHLVFAGYECARAMNEPSWHPYLSPAELGTITVVLRDRNMPDVLRARALCALVRWGPHDDGLEVMRWIRYGGMDVARRILVDGVNAYDGGVPSLVYHAMTLCSLPKVMERYAPDPGVAASMAVDAVPKRDYQQLVELLETGMYSDFEIHVEEAVFKVHRSVLAPASPYFKVLFQAGMADAVESRITITDFPTDTVRAMLHWMYGGGLRDDIGDPEDLLLAADKYMIPDLVNALVPTLCDELDEESVLDMYERGVSLKCRALIDECVAYATRHLAAVFDDMVMYGRPGQREGPVALVQAVCDAVLLMVQDE